MLPTFSFRFPRELPPTNTTGEPANVFNMPNCLENICPKVGRYLDTVKHLLFSLFRLGSRHLASNVHDLPGTLPFLKRALLLSLPSTVSHQGLRKAKLLMLFALRLLTLW